MTVMQSTSDLQSNTLNCENKEITIHCLSGPIMSYQNSNEASDLEKCEWGVRYFMLHLRTNTKFRNEGQYKMPEYRIEEEFEIKVEGFKDIWIQSFKYTNIFTVPHNLYRSKLW